MAWVRIPPLPLNFPFFLLLPIILRLLFLFCLTLFYICKAILVSSTVSDVNRRPMKKRGLVQSYDYFEQFRKFIPPPEKNLHK